MKRLNQLKGFKKNKKGALAIEIVIGLMMMLMIISFLTDVALLTWKFNVVAQTNTYLARTVGIQGGLLNATPPNFPGGDGAYVTKSEMNTKIADNFKKAGITDNYSYSLDKNQADYGDMIKTQITVKYKWAMLSNFVPGNLTFNITSTRSVMSEFKYRSDTIKGE